MKTLIYDIETMQELFLVGLYEPETDMYFEFEVSKDANNLDSFVRFIEAHKEHYWVGYNNLRFDSQVVEWIIRNYEHWYELGALEITAKIAQKAADVIHDANFDVFPEYREEQLSFKQIDLFRVNHYDNKNRRVSLKRLEFEMDLENIEEMPIHHTKTNMTDEEIYLSKSYCKNDVMATYEFYKVTIGDTDHPLYKGNNQIELRQDIEAEFGIPCMNYSDSKIGDEMIKKFYCQEKKIEYNALPKKGFFRKEIKVKNCIANYVTFETKALKEFHKRIKGMTLGLIDDFKESINFYNNVYTFAKGGLHTENSPKIFEADDDHFIIDWDVSSYYPAIIINNGRYPQHLGKEFLLGYKAMFEKRLELKPLAKKDKKIKGIVGALKLAVNSVYGKSSDMQSWIYDRQLTMFTTLTGELSLLMLIEQYECNDINVISANTDGVTIRIRKDLVNKMHEINAWWSEITQYELERTDYQKIIFSTVNDYLAIKTDGDVKKKGDFLTDFELHKNKSARVCAIALEHYFVHNVPIEQTIRDHNSIYDFCLRQKASKDFHYEGVNRTSGDKTIYNKLIRYYVSKSGEKLLKVKNEGADSNAAEISQVEAGEWVMHVCNHLTKEHPLTNVNFDYYIERANRIVHKIQTEGKKRKIIINPDQMSLF
jgi:DNA polymerase elongation subunit (family B)